MIVDTADEVFCYGCACLDLKEYSCSTWDFLKYIFIYINIILIIPAACQDIEELSLLTVSSAYFDIMKELKSYLLIVRANY